MKHSSYTAAERLAYVRNYNKQLTGRFCDCGQPAVKKDGSGWNCQACLDKNELHFTGCNYPSRTLVGVKEAKTEPGLTRRTLQQAFEPYSISQQFPGFNFGWQNGAPI